MSPARKVARHQAQDRPASGGRTLAYWLLLGLLVVATAFACWQPVRDNPLEPVRGGNWFGSKQETNAWARLLSPDAELRSVHFPDAQHGWAVGDDGMILATADGGMSWLPQPSKTRERLVSVHFADARHGWTVGLDGTILATADGGKNWLPQPSKPGTILLSVHFADAQHGWVVGYSGTILATADGGKNWLPQQSKTREYLRSVHFAVAQHGWAVSSNGAILATADGGLTWREPRYRVALAPWWYLTAALLLCSLALVTLRKPRPTPAVESIADVLLTDSPLADARRDLLGFQPLALGISRFLRNLHTEPPLTLAVTGPWGSGKSSLMNLVRADMDRHGFRTVWFNAWHHQQEESLLAALLESLRDEAVPPIWTLEGAVFALRLLWQRRGRDWPWKLLVYALTAAAVGYFVAHPTELPSGAIAADPIAFLRDVGEALGSGSQSGAVSKTLATLSLVVLAAVTFYKQITAFGVKPRELLTDWTSGARIGTLEAKTSLRHRFARELEDVVTALRPRRLVLFIDDLDRCEPAKVLAMLETVNFLVSSADVVVVFGMARERVEHCVALHFKDLVLPVNGDPKVEEVKEEGASADEPESPLEFARSYLEKLINVEVPVPRASAVRFARLAAAGDPSADGGDPSPLVALGRAVWPWVRTVVPPVLAVGLVLGAGVIGSRISAPGAAMQALTSVASAPEKPVTPPKPVEEESQKELPAANERDSGSYIREGQKASPSPWIWVVALGIALVLGVVQRVRRAEDVTRDSEDFQDALRAWAPVLFAERPTPRAFKRFVNRMRFVAMLQAPVQAEPGWREWAWWRDRLRKKETSTASTSPAERLPESVLVTLAVLAQCEPELITEEGLADERYTWLDERLGEERALFWLSYLSVEADHVRRFRALAGDFWKLPGPPPEEPDSDSAEQGSRTEPNGSGNGKRFPGAGGLPGLGKWLGNLVPRRSRGQAAGEASTPEDQESAAPE